MNILRSIHVIDTHTVGEPTRIVLGGIPPLPGKTMEERRRWLANNADGLRQFLLQEPRGHRDMFAAIVTPPISSKADFGLIFCDGEGYLGMCGHGTIGSVTALASLGWTKKEELLLDTPSGLVRAHIHWKENVPAAISFHNVPSFYLETVAMNGIPIHIAYGGNTFALVDVRSVNLHVQKQALSSLIHLGMKIRRHLNKHHLFHHPATGLSLEVQLVEFYEQTIPPRNVVIFGHGQVDRSPCGTGTSAKMAFLHEKGELKPGEEYRYLSVLGTEFIGKIVAETTVGDRPGIIPEVTGSAYVTGLNTLLVTEGDPFPCGFALHPIDQGDDFKDQESERPFRSCETSIGEKYPS